MAAWLHGCMAGSDMRGPMYVADCVKAMDRFGNRFAQIYGQGESPMTITSLTKSMRDRMQPEFLHRLGSCGVAQTGVELRTAKAKAKAKAKADFRLPSLISKKRLMPSFVDGFKPTRRIF